MNKQHLFVLFFLVLMIGSGIPSDSFARKKGSTLVGPVERIRVAWDYSSIRQLAPSGGYARLLRLKDQSIVVVSEDYKGSSFLIRSYDEGETWSDPVNIFPRTTLSNGKEQTIVNMSNPEIIQLHNGDIVVACNYRPRTPEITPFAIAIRRSCDNGITFNDPQIIYKAEPRFSDGCWEPSFLQLPNGELQVYFANEGPYTHSDEQEITVISSLDNGESWGNTRTVSFRRNHRDGMPVARVINEEIVVVIEDNKSGKFRPYTVRTKLSDNWTTSISGNSINRDSCLTENINKDEAIGAPYLLVLPTGETMISYYTTEGRTPDWEKSTMEVAIGDQTAHKLERRTRPFPIPDNKEGKWSSIAMWNKNTIAALTSSNFRSDRVAPYLIKGYVLSDVQVKEREITTFPIFVGATTEANIRVGVGVDDKHIYLKCKINDSTPIIAPEKTQEGDGVLICINTNHFSVTKPDKGIFRLWCSRTGEISLWEGNGGRWRKVSPTGIDVGTSSGNVGYDLDIMIPKKRLGKERYSIRLGVGLSNYISQDSGNSEFLIHADENSPNSWIRVDFR